MSSLIAHMVELCIRRAWVVILAAGLLGCGCAVYAARHFAISTDVRKLLSPDLPWRQRELAYQAAFPQQNESILAVIEARGLKELKRFESGPYFVALYASK